MKNFHLYIVVSVSGAAVLALPVHEPGIIGNIVLISANRKLEFPEERLELPENYAEVSSYKHWTVDKKNYVWNNRFTPETGNIKAMTDDLNSVDIWSEVINLAARKDLHEYFGSRRSAW